MKTETNGARRQVSSGQLIEAEEGLIRLLYSKGFTREWVERHVPEIMAQARSDFAVRLVAGRRDDAVNLLVVIAYRRAMKVLSQERRRPRMTPIETVFDLSDPSASTPEERAVEQDRQRRLIVAMRELPERDRKLLSLIYFGEMSLREAARRLGIKRSTANRRHHAALEQLRSELGDRSLLGADIAVVAGATGGEASWSDGVRIWLEGAATTGREMIHGGASRIGVLGEAGNAAALSGAGRAGAGVCGAVVVACLAGTATGIVGPGVAGIDAVRGDDAREAARHRGLVAPTLRAPEPAVEQPATGAAPQRTEGGDGTGGVKMGSRSPGGSGAGSAAAPQRTGRENFGFEGGGAQGSPAPDSQGGSGSEVQRARSSGGGSGASGTESGGGGAVGEFNGDT